MEKKTQIDRSEIKRRRQSLGFTLMDAAKRAGMKFPQQWQELEEKRKNPTIATVGAMATALQCQVSDLLRK